jgi:transglutaminase/protease-like cytokinesis protein 3
MRFSYLILILGSCLVVQYGIAQKRMLWPSFNKADSIANYYKGASLDDVRTLTLRLTMPLETEVEKFRAIYRWICLNVGYDRALFEMHQRKLWKYRKDSIAMVAWDRKITKQSFERLRLEKLALCTTYAYLVELMCSYAQITSVRIDGYGSTKIQDSPRRPTHTWNAVIIDGAWYLCDATWSSGVYDQNLRQFISVYNDVYFLADPVIFYSNHKPQDARWSLL